MFQGRAALRENGFSIALSIPALTLNLLKYRPGKNTFRQILRSATSIIKIYSF